jgi:hypothetical protein
VLRLLAGLLTALAVLQLLLLPLARLLGRRLHPRVVLVGVVLPLLVLAPWLRASHLLVPCNTLAVTTPGLMDWKLPLTYQPLNDAVYQLLPWELEVRHALIAGRLPLWSDRLGGGSSPWSNPQAQALSPLAMLARLLPLQHHLLALLALKMLLAAEGMWLLARRLGARDTPALVAAASFACGGAIVGWSVFPLSTAIAWAPWVVAGVVAIARGGGRRAVVGLALATAGLWLAGHPEAALGAVVLAALGGLWLRARRVRLPRFLALAASGGTLGTLLAAPLLVPFTRAAAGSLRAGERLALHPGSFLPSTWLGWFRAGPQILLAPLSPRVFGWPYGPTFGGALDWPTSLAGYAGLAALAGAAAALGARTRRRAAPFLVAALVALLAAARFVPLDALLLRLPVVRLAELTRFVPLAALSVALASALGWDRLRRARSHGPRIAAALALVLAVGLAPSLAVAAFAALVLAAAVLLRARPRLALAALAAALLLDLVPWARAQLPADDPGAFYPRTAFVDRLIAVASEPGGPWRVLGENYALYPSRLAVHGLDEVRVHDPLAPRALLGVLDAAYGFAPSSTRYFSKLVHADHPLSDFLGVHAVVSDRNQAAKPRLEEAVPWSTAVIDGRPMPVPVFGPHVVYRNPAALPRWFLPPRVEVVPRAGALDWIRRMRDGRVVALLAEEARGWQPAARGWHAADVHALATSPGHVTLAVEGTGERLLATSLPGPFGWRATADGRALATLTVDAAYLGVRVPAGVSRVELRYVPPGLPLGGTLAAAALLVVLGLVGREMLAAQRGRPASA